MTEQENDTPIAQIYPASAEAIETGILAIDFEQAVQTVAMVHQSNGSIRHETEEVERSQAIRMSERWSEEDKDYLREHIGEWSTDELATRLGRTRKSIQHQMHALGISPYTNDGRYTATELAEQIGVPASTLLEWIRLGKIAGEKVGNIWRIEWDGRHPVVPIWDGKHGYAGDTGHSSENVGTCTVCGAQLKQGDFFCSKKCQGESMHTRYEKLKEIYKNPTRHGKLRTNKSAPFNS